MIYPAVIRRLVAVVMDSNGWIVVERCKECTGCPKKTHFQNCVGYVWGPNFLVILVILNKHHCSRHFRPLLVFLVILAHLLVNPGLFGHFWLFLVILVIFGYFGYFWLFLVIFGYFWLFLVIFGYF